MSIFTENYLHELPEEIQMKIIKLSKKRKCNIVYYTTKEEICFINHLIDININNKILDFEYTIKALNTTWKMKIANTFMINICAVIILEY